ncbi:MAG: hypothetical protein KDB79_05480, partial [Acidobacteria bacterium]|nr:hypothetical protein [Acidobacteriota bacterium]
MQDQEWTIMVYMAGDNNLSVDMAYAMEQIKEFAAGDTDRVNLFVYYDGKSQSIPTLYCDFSDSKNPRQVRSYLVSNKLYPVKPEPDENAADHRSIINFVDWCVNTVPYEENGETYYGRKARRYALIFSGHSMGFQDIGMFKDETSDHTLSMEKMNWLLGRITKTEEELLEDNKDLRHNEDSFARATTEILAQKLDILGFDSCVMGMLEVGHQFSDVAKTMIASEGSVPSAGWTYAKILGNLACQSKGLDINEVTSNFVSEFVRSQDSYTIGGVAVDMAAWDLSKLNSLNKEFAGLSKKLIECFEDSGSTLYRQMERVLLQVHWKCQSYMLEQNVDLGDFCSLLKDECASLMKELGGDSAPILEDIERHCEGVLRELGNAVILSGFSGGKYQYSNGISLFFPWSLAAYEVSRDNYESLEFVENTDAGRSWNEFLNKYLSEVTYRHALKPTNVGAEPKPLILESALSVSAGAEDTKLRYYSYEYRDHDLADAEASFGTESAQAAKMGGREGTKMGGREGTKMGGREGTKMGGREGTKMGGGGGSGAFFDSFELFKNIETPWNLSGFTKTPKP